MLQVSGLENSSESTDVNAKHGDDGEDNEQKGNLSDAASNDSSSSTKDPAGASASKTGHFVCKECPFATRDMGRLTTHEEGHRRERGFQCPMCTYRSESAGFLRRHCDCHGKGQYPWPPVYIGRSTTIRESASASSMSTNNSPKQTETTPNQNNVVRKKTVRNSNDVPVLAHSSKKSSSAIPVCREVQHSTKKGFSLTSASTKTTSIRIKKSFERRFVDKPRKRPARHQQQSFKGIVRGHIGGYKCFCCSARFLTNYERSAHRFRCRRARRIPRSLYTALFKERTDAFKRDKKLPNDAASSDRSTPVEHRVHRCAHCPFTCLRKSRLQRHENKHFVKAEHQCTHCSFSCRSVDILTQHSRLHQPSRLTQMPGRPKEFSLTEDILSGAASSSIGKVEKCSECPYRSRHLCDMKAHAAMHIGMREFPCNRCTYSTKRAHVLEAHLQMHAEEDGLPTSSQQGNSDIDLKKRISIRWHGKIIGTRSGTKLTRVYACNFCPFRTRFCAPLFTHFRNHTGQRALRCTRCTFSTSVPRKLHEHRALHPLTRGVVPSSRNTHPDGFFTCRECPFSCDSYGKLWHHAQKHKRASRFSCDLCTFSTGSSSCLAEHRALHSCSVPSESRMEEIIVVSDTASMKEYEVFGEVEDMEVDEQHTTNVDQAMEQETCGGEPVSSTTSLSSTESGRRQAIEEEQEDVPMEDSSPSLVEDDEEDPFVSNELELLMRIRKAHSDSLVPSGKSYRCNECPFISEDKMVLAFHTERHKAKTGHLRCNMCSYRAHTPEALCNHITLHTQAHPQAAAAANFKKRKLRRSSPDRLVQNGKLLKCTKCAYQTSNTDRYTAHCLEHAMRIQRRLETSIRRSKSNGDGMDKKQKGCRPARKIDGQQFCWKCSFQCDSESALGTHMEFHGLTAPFVCSICDYGSFSKNVVRFHEMNHHLDVPLTSFCNDSLGMANQPKGMITMESPHLQTVEQKLRCNRCNSILYNFASFEAHCKLFHNDNDSHNNFSLDEHMKDQLRDRDGKQGTSSSDSA